MDKRLQDLLDHHEIRKTLAEYCQGADRCDGVHMRSVYVEDSWDEHGALKASGPDFARIMSEQIRRASNSLSHLLGQSTIRVDGDRAGAETYFLAVSAASENGVDMCNQLGGRFVDRLERHEGQWLLKHRVVVRDWTVSLPQKDWSSAMTLTPGQRSDADPCYEALGRRHSGIPKADQSQ